MSAPVVGVLFGSAVPGSGVAGRYVVVRRAIGGGVGGRRVRRGRGRGSFISAGGSSLGCIAGDKGHQNSHEPQKHRATRSVTDLSSSDVKCQRFLGV